MPADEDDRYGPASKPTGRFNHSTLSAPEYNPARISELVPPPTASVGARWRFRRNLIIYIASQNGASQRLIADVFDLPHSRIAAIIKEFRLKYGGE